jgi:methylthioribose-1-phosphate isomerase
MKESPLFWPAKLVGNGRDRSLHVLDETLIPEKMHYIKVKNAAQAVRVIKEMKTRAFGQFLVVLNTFLLVLERRDRSPVQVIKKTAAALNASRPTFPFSEVTSIVVGWAEQAEKQNFDVAGFVRKNIHGYLAGIRARRLGRVAEVARLIQNGDSVLTHCNVSGELAMAAQLCRKQRKKVHFFATETRPYFQGAKLTAWELKESGAPVTLIADNAVGSLLSDGLVDKVIVGSDRSCANGDIANKIGTYQIAVLAKEFGVPFYALTQPSNKIKKGKDIPIEIREPAELLKFRGKKIVPGRVKGFYPGFDVVPHSLIRRSVAIDVR